MAREKFPNTIRHGFRRHSFLGLALALILFLPSSYINLFVFCHWSLATFSFCHSTLVTLICLRQVKIEGDPFIGVVLRPDVAAVGFDDGTAQREPHP